jgi:cell division protein FtsQ
MDPRIGRRRVAVTREAGRRRLTVVLTLLITTAVVLGGWFWLHTWPFTARVVTVRGAVHETDAQVLAAAGLTGHPPLIDVNTGGAVARIERLPWVDRASVSRGWPDALHVVVTERTPVAWVTVAHGAGLVDRSGRVLGIVPAAPPGLPALLGFGAAHPGRPGSILSPAPAGALTVADTLPLAFSAQVVSISERQGTVSLGLTTPVTVVLGTTADLQKKYEDVAALLAGATLHDGDVIDVSVAASPTVSGP